MGVVDRIKALCKEKGIPISRLEKDCGFANAYIVRLKKDAIPADRLQKIADRLNVSVTYLMTGEDDSMRELLEQNEAEMERLHRAAFRPEVEMLLDVVKDAPSDILVRLRYYAEGLMAGRKG